MVEDRTQSGVLDWSLQAVETDYVGSPGCSSLEVVANSSLISFPCNPAHSYPIQILSDLHSQETMVPVSLFRPFDCHC